MINARNTPSSAHSTTCPLSVRYGARYDERANTSPPTSWKAKRTAISDKTLAALAVCDKLVDLHVQGTKVTAEGIEKLRKSHPQCRMETDGGTFEPKK